MMNKEEKVIISARNYNPGRDDDKAEKALVKKIKNNYKFPNATSNFSNEENMILNVGVYIK